MQVIAHLRSPLIQKFGVARQPNLTPHLRGHIVFEAAYRQREFFRGIDTFTHLWVIWKFHLNGDVWHPTVRPPILGGNKRVGVFATRSPFRPNPLGLSVLKLEEVLWDTPEGPILVVSGADLVDGTPIFDIKPYIAYADAHPEALGGFCDDRTWGLLQVELAAGLSFPADVDENWILALKESLAQDPRPAYQKDERRVYHLMMKPYELSFHVKDSILIIERFKKLS